MPAATKAKISASMRLRYLEGLEGQGELDRKRCSKCGVYKTIREFTMVKGRPLKSGGWAPKPCSWCRACTREHSRQTRERYRAEGTLAERKRQEEGREDPERRRRRKREQGAIERRKAGVKARKPFTQALHAGVRLEPGPIVELLAKELRLRNGQGTAVNQHHKGLGVLAEHSGVPPRRIWGLIHGEYEHVALSVVDRLLIGLGLPHMLAILYPEA